MALSHSLPPGISHASALVLAGASNSLPSWSSTPAERWRADPGFLQHGGIQDFPREPSRLLELAGTCHPGGAPRSRPPEAEGTAPSTVCGDTEGGSLAKQKTFPSAGAGWESSRWRRRGRKVTRRLSPRRQLETGQQAAAEAWAPRAISFAGLPRKGLYTVSAQQFVRKGYNSLGFIALGGREDSDPP